MTRYMKPKLFNKLNNKFLGYFTCAFVITSLRQAT